METRTRSKRGVAAPSSPSAPQPQKAMRNTRQPSAEASSARQNQPAKASSTNSKPGSLTADPVARRNARVTHARSIASLPPTQTGSDGEEEEEEEDEDEDEIGYEDAGDSGRESGVEEDADEQERQEEEKIRRDIMALTLPDLSKAAADFMKVLQTANYSSAVSRGILKMKRNAFLGFRDAYEDPDQSSHSIFLNWTWLDLVTRPDFSETVKKVLATANLATALDNIEHIRTSETKDAALPFLKELDAGFPGSLAILDDAAKYSVCALDIRTAYLVEALSTKAKSTDPRAVIASIFCEPTKSKDYAHLFANGPFRRLGGSDDVDEDTRHCSDRIMELLPVIKADKKAAGIKQLRERFPLDGLLGQLKKWVQEVYPESAEDLDGLLERWQTQATERDEFYDAEEDQESQSLAESQPIVRALGKEKPLFVSSSDINHLKTPPGAPPPRKPVPTSGQRPPSNAPSDYREHTTRELLEASQPGPSRSAPKRPRDAYDIDNVADDDEDDFDPFETDTRAVDEGKRRALQASNPQSKRPRTANTLPVRALAPSSSMPPPAARAINPNPNPNSSPPSASQANLAHLKREKLAYMQSVRAQRPPNLKQRYAWTDRDAALLIELVKEHSASWSVIETNAVHAGFDHLRNQQAYRDKARNMKVDFLITDTVLPPCFDSVVLGKKEIDRLISLGKNPYRKEADVTESGQIFNTELTEGED